MVETQKAQTQKAQTQKAETGVDTGHEWEMEDLAITTHQVPSQRSDARRTRDRLIDATGELLEAAGPQFTLAELARQAGVGTATVYRHFETINDAMIAFENRTIEGLNEQISQIRRHSHGLECFRQVCLVWATRAATVSAAARYVRSPAGFLERLAQQDLQISELSHHLRLILTDLAEDGGLPVLDGTAMNTATLLWVTLFDERMVVDLTRTQGWSASRTADFLGTFVRAGLQSTD